jgi:thymidylate synthase
MAFSNTFQNIIKHIDESQANANNADPRGLKVKESILSSFIIDPASSIANFENRKFNWKYLAGELAWYLKKDRDVDFIGNFSGFWSTLTNPDSNEINSNYGSLVFNKEQFGWVIDSLVADKYSRQAIMFFNQPKFQFKENKDFVCTMYSNFFIRDNKLNMKVQMRSNDIFYGLTFDAPFFAFLMQSVHIKLLETYPDLELGQYYHFADNLHYYERHFDLAGKIVEEEIDQKAESNFVLKNPFIDYDGEKVFLTETGEQYCKDIYESIGEDRSTLNREEYKELLSKYFVL